MRKIIYTMFSAVIILAVIGIMIIASVKENTNPVTVLTFKDFIKLFPGNALFQLFCLLIGMLLVFGISFWNYQMCTDKRFMWALLGVSLVLLVLVFVPHIGWGTKGSQRWINLYFTKVQPSEFVKLALVLLASGWGVLKIQSLNTWKNAILYPGLALGSIIGLVLLETDVGAALVMLAISGAILFVSGLNFKNLCILGGLGVAALVIVIACVRSDRILSFINPKMNTEYTLQSDNPGRSIAKQEEARDQPKQAAEALKNGGLMGVGFMQSYQKKNYLREAHTDFIFAIIGEEFGFIGSSVVLGLFLTLLVCGCLVALRAPDRLGKLLAFGMTFMLTFQACVNLMVVTNMSPTTGITLPFVSYGGTSLMASMVAIGIIFSVARKIVVVEEAEKANVYRDSVTIN